MLIERSKRLSESMIWQLQRDYYEKEGPSAWQSHEVPHYITNNSWIASKYASFALQFLKHQKGSGHNHVNILELGAGTGRFAFLFINHLLSKISNKDIGVSFTYHLSDFSDKNIAFWENQGQFRSLASSGILGFRQVDATQIDHASITDLEGDPLILIANYFFDSIPQDGFDIRDNRLYEHLVSVYKKPDTDKAETTISNIFIQHESRMVSFEYYDDPLSNQLLRSKSSADCSLLFPYLGIQCIDHFRRLCNDNLMLLASDKGVVPHDHIIKKSDLALEKHGSFSMPVDFDIIGKYFELKYGESIISKFRPHNLVFGLYTTHSFEDDIKEKLLKEIDFGPEDYLLLQEAMTLKKDELTLEQIVAAIKFSEYDPIVFLTHLKRISDIITSSSKSAVENLEITLDRIWKNYFNIGESHDFAFKLGLLLTNIGRYEKALHYFNISCSTIQRPVTLYNIALCHAHLKDVNRALSILDKVLQIQPTFNQAIELKEKISPTS